MDATIQTIREDTQILLLDLVNIIQSMLESTVGVHFEGLRMGVSYVCVFIC